MAKPVNKNKNKQPLKITENHTPGKVKMRFKEHKYYNDLDKPHFEAGKVYELEGAGWIQRWLKRGGEIVEGGISYPTPIVNTSDVVDKKEEKVEYATQEEAQQMIDSGEAEIPEEAITEGDKE